MHCTIQGLRVEQEKGSSGYSTENLRKDFEAKINELRAKYATLAGILERIHNMDLRETAIGLLGIDAMESLLKLRALVILAS